MNPEPINIVMLMLLLLLGVIGVALYLSPDALDTFARKMRARARAKRAADELYRKTYNESIREDIRLDKEREEVRKLIDSASVKGEE